MPTIQTPPALQQAALAVEVVRQHPGPQQVNRAVKLKVPGRHFPGLQPAEQKAFYDGTAAEFAERHKFKIHLKAWGGAHTGPGVRFVCDSDALDDPDHRGFWTTLALWNRWRHDTYKDNRQDELQYLDELPAEPAGVPDAPARVKAPPEVKKCFSIASTGTHTYGGLGKLSGKQAPCTWYACLKEGCPRGPVKPIKQVGTATGQLFCHLEQCQPELCRKLRADSKFSPVCIGDDGEEYALYNFNELLPHHAQYVEKCFRGLDHFYEARAGNGLLDYVQGWDKRASLPCEKTSQQLLEVSRARLEASPA